MKLPFKHRASWRRGFSLPEVAIAIGIAGVALISVVGLMPALTDSDRRSGLNTALPQLTSQAMAELRSSPYPATFPHTVEMYFSGEGALLTGGATDPQRRMYHCVATLMEIVGSNPVSPVEGGVPSLGKQACLVKLQFNLASEPNATPRILHAALAK